MKHNTFEPCKDHENGHFGWCLLCEIEQLRKKLILLGADNESKSVLKRAEIQSKIKK